MASVITLALFATEHANAPSLPEIVALTFFPVGVCVGMILAWWRELAGGIVGVVSFVIFCLYMFMQRGEFHAWPNFLIFASPAFVFLAAAILDRARPRRIVPE